MSFIKPLNIPTFLLLALFFTHSNATTINAQNNCSYTVWAAAIPGGGARLDTGEMWAINVSAGTTQVRIWARTGCNFDALGQGSCQTGDCSGRLQCQAYGSPPNTLVEYAQLNNVDYFDISLIDGFNVPLKFKPISNGCTRSTECTADINEQCPNELRVSGGCNHPCTVFKTDQYCCYSGNCVPTTYTQFFKNSCPDAYSYYRNDPASTLTCPGGTNYKVVFCP